MEVKMIRGLSGILLMGILLFLTGCQSVVTSSSYFRSAKSLGKPKYGRSGHRRKNSYRHS